MRGLVRKSVLWSPRGGIHWLLTAALLATVLLAFGEEPEEAAEHYTELAIGKRTSAVIDWARQPWASFVVEVPTDAIVLTVTVEDAQADLDLFGRRGRPIANFEDDSEFQASTRLYNDTLRISRGSEPPLEPGKFYVDVAYNVEAAPRVGKRRVAEIGFNITAQVIRARVDGELSPGAPVASETSPQSGWFRTYRIAVPADAKALRLDLDRVTSDLDLSLRHDRPVLKFEDGDHVAESTLGRETLLIDAASDPPLKPGVWYATIYDPFELDQAHFTAHLSFEPQPAPELLAIPTLREPAEGIDRALLATVEVLTRSGTGSGTLIGADGWVLTNYHVIEDDSCAIVPRGEVVISLNVDPKLPPAELFRGSVVVADPALDLALVKIESGLYGQALPSGYRFPFVKLGNTESLHIGDPVTVVGFPGVGGLGSRATVSLTRGVIAGFDTTDAGVILKTDAEIASGNSGGAALDASLRLIGVPAGTIEDVEGYSQLGYILPIDRLPEGWRQRIGS